MKIDYIFLIILGLILLYQFCSDTVTEKFGPNIGDADISAIRNLNGIATKLMAGGLTVPGSVAISDNVSVTNNTNEGGRVRILNTKKTEAGQTNDWSIWNMTGPDYGNKLSFWRYNADGVNAGSAMDIFDNGNVNIRGSLAMSDNVSVTNNTNEGGRIRILNTKKKDAGQTNDWSIWNMTGPYGNKLSFWRYNADGVNAGPAMDIFDNGNVNISGDLTINGPMAKIMVAGYLHIQAYAWKIPLFYGWNFTWTDYKWTEAFRNNVTWRGSTRQRWFHNVNLDLRPYSNVDWFARDIVLLPGFKANVYGWTDRPKAIVTGVTGDYEFQIPPNPATAPHVISISLISEIINPPDEIPLNVHPDRGYVKMAQWW